jgi:hypothetical protein
MRDSRKQRCTSHHIYIAYVHIYILLKYCICIHTKAQCCSTSHRFSFVFVISVTAGLAHNTAINNNSNANNTSGSTNSSSASNSGPQEAWRRCPHHTSVALHSLNSDTLDVLRDYEDECARASAAPAYKCLYPTVDAVHRLAPLCGAPRWLNDVLAGK